MVEKIRYEPHINKRQIDLFDQRLSRCTGTWTLQRSFVHAGDPRVIHLRWVIPETPYAHPAGYISFLDYNPYRRLLRYILRFCEEDRVDTEELQRASGCSPEELQQALLFFQSQDFLVVDEADMWSLGSCLFQIANLGFTFEWIVQEILQRDHHALARRSVLFKQFRHIGDIDVLAFINENHTIAVECKTSPTLASHHVYHFIERATRFPANIALLLIDTSNDAPIQKYALKIASILDAPWELVQHASCIYRVLPNIVVANTTGGIHATLASILCLRSVTS